MGLTNATILPGIMAMGLGKDGKETEEVRSGVRTPVSDLSCWRKIRQWWDMWSSPHSCWLALPVVSTELPGQISSAIENGL